MNPHTPPPIGDYLLMDVLVLTLFVLVVFFFANYAGLLP